MTPEEFYTLFSQLPKEISVPKTLVKYTKALYKHHQLPYERVKGTSTTEVLPPYKPNKKTAVLAFSGGLDSTATLLWALKHGYNVTPVFVDMLNPSISHREKKAVMSIGRQLGVKPVVIQHSMELRRETSYKTHNLDENPAKNQYIWMRLIPIARNLNAGTIFFGDTERPAEEEKYFSDTEKSYQLFQEHSGQLIKHPPVFKSKDEAMKLLFSHDEKLFYKTSSCYSRSTYFKSNRKRSGAPKNMCGLCFKCKRLMELLDKRRGKEKEKEKETKEPRKKGVHSSAENPTQPEDTPSVVPSRNRSRDSRLLGKRSVKHSVRRHRTPSEVKDKERTGSRRRSTIDRKSRMRATLA